MPKTVTWILTVVGTIGFIASIFMWWAAIATNCRDLFFHKECSLPIPFPFADWDFDLYGDIVIWAAFILGFLFLIVFGVGLLRLQRTMSRSDEIGLGILAAIAVPSVIYALYPILFR